MDIRLMQQLGDYGLRLNVTGQVDQAYYTQYTLGTEVDTLPTALVGHSFDGYLTDTVSMLADLVPGHVVKNTKYLYIMQYTSGYGNYFDLTDLTNKRDTFIKAMKKVHDTDLKIGAPFDVDGQITMLMRKIRAAKPEDSKVIEYLYQLYTRQMQTIARRMATPQFSRYTCLNSIQFKDIYHNGNGDVKFADLSMVRTNDCAWDYATLLARSSDMPSYIPILNNNKLIAELKWRYNDENISLRIAAYISLVDILDTLQLYYNQLLNPQLNITDVLMHKAARAARFIEQSYTTIDQFSYVYPLVK